NRNLRQAMQIIDAGYAAAYEIQDHVEFAQTCALCRRSWFDRNDHRAGGDRQYVVANNSRVDGNILAGDANITALNLSVPNQADGNKLRRVRADGETDSLSAHN